MPENPENYEPIIATRRSPETQGEDSKPLWPVVLALGGGLAVVILLAWWFMGRSSSDGASTTAQSESAAPEFGPEIHVEQPAAPPARDSETDTQIAQAPAPPAPAAEPAAAAEQAATPETTPEVVPDTAVQPPVSPAPVQVHFVSPDTQVQFELRGAGESSLTSKAGDVLAIAPGKYRVMASGTQLEKFEQEVTFDGQGPQEYSVELCAERKHERENFAGQVVDERVCASTAQCESMFL
ncbi:MAG: hypothetical protein ACJ8OJ_18590, partial [Povalibacter sp.]